MTPPADKASSECTQNEAAIYLNSEHHTGRPSINLDHKTVKQTLRSVSSLHTV